MGSASHSSEILNLGSVNRMIASASMLLLLLLPLGHFLTNNLLYDAAYAQQYVVAAPGSTNSSSRTLSAINNSSSSSSNILSTSGIATTDVKPDKVTITVGVVTTNKTAKAALSSNSAAVNRVLEVLLAAGVRKNETSTSAFSVSPNYNYSQGQNKITGFTVTNSIQIQSSNINNTGAWVDTAVSSGGANTIDGVDFTLSDKKSEEVKNSLIKQAINDARTKANTAASALGLKIIGVKSINVNELEQNPPPAPQSFAKAAATPAASPTPIISGQQNISVNVGIGWLIA